MSQFYMIWSFLVGLFYYYFLLSPTAEFNVHLRNGTLMQLQDYNMRVDAMLNAMLNTEYFGNTSAPKKIEMDENTNEVFVLVLLGSCSILFQTFYTLNIHGH